MSTSGTNSTGVQVDAAGASAKTEAAKAHTDWTNLPADHVLVKFSNDLQALLQEADYSEMFGIELKAPTEPSQASPHSTLLILQKFLRANCGDLGPAKAQLLESLRWRKEYKPLSTLNETFPVDRFGGLGYVTHLTNVPNTPNHTDVASFNIYGAAAQDYTKAFGDIDAFIRWRVALMEYTIRELHLETATRPVPDYGAGPDPYQMVNVHDYLSVSFFRQPAGIRQASSKIIGMFQRNYPETVGLRFFVNVPLVMQWMMGAMKMLMSKDSIQKMTWMSYGSELHKYLGDSVPEVYGGKGRPLKEVGIETKWDTGTQTQSGEATATTDAPAPASQSAPSVKA